MNKWMCFTVSWTKNLWTICAALQFREVFPDCQLTVIHNSKSIKEKQVLEFVGCRVLDNPLLDKKPLPSNTHGLALDYAAQVCREEGVHWMIHTDPDVCIWKKDWLYNMIRAVDDGDLYMAGPYENSPIGQIHVSASIWNVNNIPGTFVGGLKTSEDRLHKRFKDLVQNKVDRICPNDQWHQKNWDVGVRNWFYLASMGKAGLSKNGGHKHHWHGRKKSPWEVGKYDNRIKDVQQKASEIWDRF